MIILDKGVLIGLLDDTDPHHEATIELLDRHSAVLGVADGQAVLFQDAREGEDVAYVVVHDQKGL